MQDRLLAGLNDAQKEAVTHAGGPLLVLAGAGTGKTRVITRRIAWLAANGVPPEQVLALTFSAKAAEEMRGRAEELLEEPYEELHCATFHAFCARLLNEEALEGGLDPFFHPVTQADRLALLMDHANEFEIRHHDLRANPAPFFATVLQRIDRLKDEMVTAEDYLGWAQSLAASPDEAERDQSSREIEFAQLYRAHDRLLDEAGAVDFGELILRAILLLGERPAVQKRVSERFRAVLVDEYQDTNFAQKELLRLLVAEHRNVVVVGDDDQSIYRFRGASRKNIYDFQESFPDAKLIRLESNYRSTQPILDAANAVVEPSEERLPKKLKAASRATQTPLGLDPVSFWHCENERAQAQAVAAEVERLVADGTDPGGCAVLVRSVRNEGQLVATALEERGIPYRLVGAAAFFERAEVRDLIAWLRLLSDPYDARAVVRALLRPPIELSPVDLARSTQIARRRKVDMITALEVALESPEVPPEGRERIEGFLRMYRSASRAFEDMRPDLFVHRLIERVGLRKQHLFSASTESLERLVNIAKFSELASSWVRREPGRGSRDFADYVTAVAQAGLREEEATVRGDSNAVRVMTMHGAKGLEFDCVYVLGVQQSRMPGTRRGGREPVPDALLKEALPENTREAHVAEMRRLLYVAMTRARRRLVLSWPESSGSGAGDESQQKPSPFYEEARAALGAEEEERREELLGIHEDLYAAFRMMRDEVLGSVAQVGAGMSEMRLDAHLDAVQAMARYMELIKLASLIERRPRQEELAGAIAEINQVLSQVASPEQQELYLGSNLDSLLLATEREKLTRAELVSERAAASLESYLPIRGQGLMLSATDIDVYRICPLRYKFARVFAIPREQTLPQRFGILMHQVLEHYHTQLANEEATGGGEPGADRLMTLFETGWRRLGFRDSNEERQLHEKAVTALDRYHVRFSAEESSPVWFERNFAFRIGPHLLRGRVDRVDRHPDGSYELIDYKTGKARRPSELKDDIQLSLYQMGARESWRLESSRQSYYYLLDDEKVPLQASEEDVRRIEETATEVAEGILAQQFDPKPSFAACSTCDFQLLCPAAER
jgi:DNA helicase II / ATP-dependent DNA helicase PcrA